MKFINIFIRTISLFFYITVLSLIFCVVMILLIPFRTLRLKASFLYARVLGGILFFLNAKIKIINQERLDKYAPCIYLLNHTSALDIPIWGAAIPFRCLAVGKKEIIFWPFIGLVYYLSGNIIIDRKNKEKAIKSLKRAANYVIKHKFSLFMWPEGTRSETGRLIPFKKGFAHFAIDTKFPIVPVIIHGAYKKWPKKGFIDFSFKEIEVEILEKIETKDWTKENLEKHIKIVEQIFIDNLCEDQKPL